jgi:hypothetical protein
VGVGEEREVEENGGEEREGKETDGCPLTVGHGQYTDEDANLTLPPYFRCPHNTVKSLIDSVYPGISHLPHPLDHSFTECCILSAHNDDVDHLNEKILNDFQGVRGHPFVSLPPLSSPTLTLNPSCSYHLYHPQGPY